ncbi:MAG: hypothetical protein QOE77_3119 [Blastocatellia bacterium]|jgi:hypothetical protein|nr:hypothetical protein [Blastocatellia bacterium]
MAFDPFPPTPTNLAPVNNADLGSTATTVTLSWSVASGAGVFALRVTDLTNPAIRHTGNNCKPTKQYLCHTNLRQTSFVLSVQPNHIYSWSIYQVDGDMRSKPATATFRTGDADGAEIVNVTVPEIIKPGGTVTAGVSVRNVGSKAWTPELGYQLGSEAPPDNTTWGAIRVPLSPGSQILPGQIATFTWEVNAPQTSGSYIFQWRMIRGGQRFGARTQNRYLYVKDRVPDLGMWVERDLGSGLLKHPAGDFITLRGGNYHIFEKNGQAQRKVVKPFPANENPQIQPPITKEYVDVTPCPPVLPIASLVNWPGHPWNPLFTSLANHKINLLRAFLMNGFGIKDEEADEVYPFNFVGGKWGVKKAITAPLVPENWNVAYFTRLKAFADAALAKGVFLQLSLFNYYELHDDDLRHNVLIWSNSIWNPKRAADSAWGLNNLVNPPPLDDKTYSCSDHGGDSAEGRRNCFFIEPPATSGLRKVQEQFVKKVVRELAGRPNIIFEVMNEPHRGSHQTSARFASQVIDWIIEAGGDLTPGGPATPWTEPWRPLISVNASRQNTDPNDPDKFDVDWWADSASNPAGDGYVKNYEEVDIISYHGLTGYPGVKDLPFKCNSAQLTGEFAPVDRDSIRARLETFRSRHPSKAIMMSTDAVRVASYKHKYGSSDETTIDLSDGQITTNLLNIGPTTYDQLVRSDLENWAYWCFKVAKTHATAIHFQNHSNFELTYKSIRAAYDAAAQE